MDPVALAAARARLRPCETRLTTPDGRCWLATDFCSPGAPLPRRPGYVVDLCPDLRVAAVRRHVCVGSQDAACDSDVLARHCVTHVLDVGTVEARLATCGEREWCHLPLLDVPECSLLPVLPRAVRFVEGARLAGGVCLVHCNAGVSRAPTVVAAYLMYTEQLTSQRAMSDVAEACSRAQRSCRPNSGFLRQLYQLEQQLNTPTEL